MSIAQRFFALFRGLDRAHGEYVITGKDATKNKVQGRAQTVLTPVTVDLWEQHLAGEVGVGIIPITDDGTCFWCAWDIDVYDLDLLGLEKKVKEANLPLFLARTKSGGAHLYCFFSEAASCQKIRTKMAQIAVSLGFPNIEMFPKQVQLASKKDVGNWLNMPYFGGEKGGRYCIHFGNAIPAEDFIDLAEKYRVSEADFLSIPIIDSEDFADAPPCIQMLAENGVPAGMRNKGLFNIAIYARKKFGDGWEEEVEKLNHQMVSPPLGSREVLTVCKSAGRKDYGYTCKEDPVASFCNRQVCRTRLYGIKDADDEPDVMLGGLEKILSEPPTWIIDVDGHRLELQTADLLNQDRFRTICVERLNKYPRRVKPGTWEKLIRERLENCETHAAPPDASPEGKLKYLVDSFCTSFSMARVQEELLAGKPWVDDKAKVIYFRYPDLSKFLEGQHFHEMTSRQIWAFLRRINATHKMFNIKGKCVQVWGVPAPAQQEQAVETNPEF